MEINQVFDEWSTEYTEKMTRWVSFYLDTIGAIISGLPEGFKPEMTLDLGCGNGNVTALLINRFPNTIITLVDASEDMLALCKDRFAGFTGMTFRQGLFQELSCDQASFDLIVAGYSLHHLKSNEKQDFFKKVFSWIKPGGYFSFCDLHIDRNNELEYRNFLIQWEKEAKRKNTPDEEWEYLMEHHMTYDFPDGLDNTKTWLSAVGFKEIKVSWQNGYWMTLLAQK